jgi:hypothetical protein
MTNVFPDISGVSFFFFLSFFLSSSLVLFSGLAWTCASHRLALSATVASILGHIRAYPRLFNFVLDLSALINPIGRYQARFDFVVPGYSINQLSGSSSRFAPPQALMLQPDQPDDRVLISGVSTCLVSQLCRAARASAPFHNRSCRARHTHPTARLYSFAGTSVAGFTSCEWHWA